VGSGSASGTGPFGAWLVSMVPQASQSIISSVPAKFPPRDRSSIACSMGLLRHMQAGLRGRSNVRRCFLNQSLECSSKQCLCPCVKAVKAVESSHLFCSELSRWR